MTEAVHSPLPLPRLRGLRRLVEISPETAHAIRSGVAVSAAIWIGKAPGLVENHSSWILITVLMVLQPTTGNSTLKSLLRIIGTVAAGFTAILLAGLFVQVPPLMAVGLFVVQAVAAYGNSGTRFQYAWFVWAFTTAIVLGNAISGQGAVETVAFQRGSFVAMGVLLVLLVESLLWPTRAEPRLRQSLARRARDLGVALRAAVSAPVDPARPAPASPTNESGTLATQLGLVGAVRTELGISRSAVDALARLAMLLETLSSRARVLAAPIARPAQLDARDSAFADALRALAEKVDAALEEVASALSKPRSPAPFSEGLERSLVALEAERDRRIARVGWSHALEGRSADLRDLVAVLRSVEETFTSTEAREKPSRFESVWRFRPDSFRMKIALRTGVAVVTAFIVPMAFGWPMNTLVAPIAFMTAAFSRGAGVQSMIVIPALACLGWLVADLTIVYLTPHIGRAPLVLVVPFGLAATFGYLAATRPQLALLPVFGGLVGLSTVFGGEAAPTDVYGPYNLICYLLLALAIGLLFGRTMWPATAATLFRQRVAMQLELCAEAVRRAGESGDVSRGQRAANLIRGCAQQSLQLGSLHQQARHEPTEHALDLDRRAALMPLAMDLMDAVLSDRPGALERLSVQNQAVLRPLLEAVQRADHALQHSMQAAVGSLRSSAPPSPSGLEEARRDLEGQIEALRKRPIALADLSVEDRRRVLVQLDSGRRLAFRQLAIEEWTARWRQADRPGASS